MSKLTLIPKSIFKRIIICIAAFIGIGSTYYLGKDNEIEQLSEHIIEYELGMAPGSIHLPSLNNEHFIEINRLND